MKNKNVILGIIIVLIMILSGIGIGCFVSKKSEEMTNPIIDNENDDEKTLSTMPRKRYSESIIYEEIETYEYKYNNV